MYKAAYKDYVTYKKYYPKIGKSNICGKSGCNKKALYKNQSSMEMTSIGNEI